MGKRKAPKQKPVPSEKPTDPEDGEIIEEIDEGTSCSSTTTTPEKENDLILAPSEQSPFMASQKPTSETTDKADNLGIGSAASSQWAAADDTADKLLSEGNNGDAQARLQIKN